MLLFNEQDESLQSSLMREECSVAILRLCVQVVLVRSLRLHSYLIDCRLRSAWLTKIVAT